MPIPTHWEGCEHVVECFMCEGKGYSYRSGTGLRHCPFCGKRGVHWNNQTIPPNMILRDYWVRDGKCYHKTVPMTEAQVIAAIWELDGPVVKRTPAPLHLLDGVPVCTSN